MHKHEIVVEEVVVMAAVVIEEVVEVVGVVAEVVIAVVIVIEIVIVGSVAADKRSAFVSIRTNMSQIQ